MGTFIPSFSTDRAAPALTLSAGLSSGFPHLDRLLPGGGWPTGAVSEILARRGHVDPVSLLLPALAPLSWEGRWVAWLGEQRPSRWQLEAQGFDCSRVLTVRPRRSVSALALAEQALWAGNCGAILLWQEHLDRFALSRLQQAARGGDTAVFVFLPPSASVHPLAGELRVYVSTHSRRLAVEILACRGGVGSVLQLDRQSEEAAPWQRVDGSTGNWLPKAGKWSQRREPVGAEPF